MVRGGIGCIGRGALGRGVAEWATARVHSGKRQPLPGKWAITIRSAAGSPYAASSPGIYRAGWRWATPAASPIRFARGGPSHTRSECSTAISSRTVSCSMERAMCGSSLHPRVGRSLHRMHAVHCERGHAYRSPRIRAHLARWQFDDTNGPADQPGACRSTCRPVVSHLGC
jgi:hypothetical protein